MDATGSAKRIKSALACPLPEEIVEDILSRLPAKSLRRFQCVSRWFQAMIASRAFQDAHYQRNKGNRRLFLKPAGFRDPFYAWQPGQPMEKIMSSSHLPQGSIFPIAAKSCHGLVLLSCLEYHMHYVWNPATREILTLPDNIPLMAARSARRPKRLVSYGLGYCSATHRHKVVRMYRVGDCCGSAPATICEVFTLNESACWRPAALRPPQHFPRQNWRQGAVLCNGILHFLQEGGDITTFNVTDETFGMLKPPPELQSCSNFELTELAGCLCAYTLKEWYSLDDEYEYTYYVCQLRDYEANGPSWKKLCCINWGNMLEAEYEYLKSSWIAPLDMYSDGNNQMKIMFSTGLTHVLIVDPSIPTLEILFSPEDVIIGECQNDQLPTVGLFEESLAWVGNTSEKALFSSPWMQVWSEVLSRLSARTVVSLNQVCRGWHAMIKAEGFVAAHLYNANLNKSPEMMFFGGKPYGFVPVKYFVNTPNMPPLIDEGLRVICSKPCHGLNAGSFTKFDFVCNPVTGYFKALPLNRSRDLKGLSLYDFLREVVLHTDPIFAGRLGLGYEQETSRHVLVRLTCQVRDMTMQDYKLVCEMRYVEDMFWFKIDPPPRPIANMPPGYVNGKLYWMADTELGQKWQRQEIIVLDISMRKFEVLQGPPCNHDHNDRVSILELQELICVACLHQSTDTILIWAMDVNGSWSTKYHIELGRHSPEYSPELVTPLAVNPMDGKILLSTGRALGYYDPKTAELETIYRLGKHIKGKKFVPVLFQESLISPRDPVY